MRKWVLSRLIPCVILLSVCVSAHAQTPIPGKYYEYYTVARTGSTFTSLGNSPSINWFGEVAFEASTSAGNGLWYGTKTTNLFNFNPGESFASSDIIQPGVQINNENQVVSEDRITTTSPASTNIRLYNGLTTDSYKYIARGGPFGAYNAVFANPATNDKGDVVFTADNGSLPAKVLGYVAGGTTTVVPQMIYSGNPKAMIANNGTVVVTVGGAGPMSNYQVRAYVQPFSSTPVIIADTASSAWLSLDNDPGISKDGHIIVFQGTVSASQGLIIGTTPGPGIFAAIDTGTGFANATYVRITGAMVEDVPADLAAGNKNQSGYCNPTLLETLKEICKPAAELGFDASGTAITFSSYGADSRVGVMDVDFGAAGIANDSFVVSFLATPSESSRANPALPTFPLLFSSALGLWTIRVDVQNQLDSPFAMVFHPFTPIPVVQVGDTLGSDIITGLSVYDPIAPAGYDETLAVRTMRRGDHRVAFWASTASGQVIVRANHLDSDQDGLLDHWETTGIDMDQDGAVDLDLSDYGANPFQRDIFIQVDWVGLPGAFTPFKPAGGIFSSDVAGTYSSFEKNFRNAEELSGPMYGATVDGSTPASIAAGMIPHVDGGSGIDSLKLPMSINLSGGTPHGGNAITMPGGTTLPAVVYFGQPGVTSPGVNVRAFQDIRDHYFGLFDKNARLLAFHYAVFAPFQDFNPNIPATPQTNTITAVDDLNIIEITPLPTSFSPSFFMMTSGADAGDVLRLGATPTVSTTDPPNVVLTANEAFKMTPATGDTIVFLEPSSGLSEAEFAPSPDFNSLPGSGVIVSTGALGVLSGVPPNQCDEWRTAGHELGHDLGLRHGGTDHNTNPDAVPPIKENYHSIMNYDYQFANCLTSPIQGYANSTDAVFDDYANLRGNFADVEYYVSTALGTARGEGTISELAQQSSEQTLADIISQNGPLDVLPPVVAITSPSAGAGVPLGSTLTVNINATDNVAINHVTANFDINGDGIVETGEAIMATSTGTNTYQAVFAGVTGPAGLRPVSAIGWDSSSNTTLATLNVNVGGVSTPPAANIAAIAGTPQSTTITLAFSTALQAKVTDASNNPVSGASVTFTAPSAGASGFFPGGLLTAIVSTNGSGIATAPTLTANTAAGAFIVSATVSGVATAANFALTNTTGSAFSLAVLAGTPQSSAINTTFATPLQAVVKDFGGNPVSGIVVTFTAPGSGASGLFSNTTATIAVATNSSGVASASFTANGTTGGPYLVTAASPGLATVDFSLTNTSAAALPEPTQVSPGAGSGTTQTFTFSFTDPAGFADLSVLDILMNNYLDGIGACYIAVAPVSAASGYLYLVADAGGGYVSGTPVLLPSSGSFENSQCTINGSGSSVSASGNTLTLTLNITFAPAFAGNKIFYMAARSATQNSGWQALGTWNVPGPAVVGPGVAGVTPGRSVSTGQTYTFSFTDSSGYADLAVLDVLTNSFLDGITACYFAYVPTSSTNGYLYLVDDAGDGGYASGSPILLSSGESLKNSQCTINTAGGSASASGDTLNLNLPIAFSPGFAGNQVFYLASRNSTTGNSGWQPAGSVTVP
ncbi:MAG TPA: Ig-like domain-containing protein [Bryobacteraceae bacterium]|jgi:hypothetical protein